MEVWTTIMNCGSSVLKKCVMLAFLLTGTAYSGQQVSKPYKVCPPVVQAKDTPCRAQGAEAAIVVRNMEQPANNLESENKELRKIIERLVDKIKELEDRLDQPKPN